MNPARTATGGPQAVDGNYGPGGGLSSAGRARREAVRPQAPAMFEQGVSLVQVARELRVSTKSAC